MIAGHVQAFFTVPSGQTLTATDGDTGATAVSLTAGSYTITTFVAHVAARLTTVMGAGWTATLSVGSSGTGKVSITYTGSGTYAITWTTTDTRDILGFDANLVAVTQGVASVGALQARGLWMPDCVLVADSDLKQAPTVTDRREVVGPTGASVTLVGCDRYEHTGLMWEYVAIHRMWITEETTTNQSYERFHRDAIRGNGHSWFTPGSALTITDHRSILAGAAASIVSWKVVRAPDLAKLRMSVDKWTGLWRVEWPTIVSAA